MVDDDIWVVYAFVIDGIGCIFVSDEALADEWAIEAGFDRTHCGLVPPRSLPCGTDLRTGLLTDDTSTIEIHDVDGTLAALFRAPLTDVQPLVVTLEPGAVGSTQARGKHVGTEYIDSEGNRRVYSCIPGFAVGMKHFGQNEAALNDVGVTWVSSSPHQWEGRRCAVYRVKNVDGVWQTLAKSKRIWWGQLRGRGEYQRGRWSLACFGPQSWLTPGLGRGRFKDGIRVIPEIAPISVSNNQHILYAALDIVRLDQLGSVKHDYGDTAVFQNTTYLLGVDTYAGMVAALNDFLGDVVSDTTNGQAYNLNGNDIYVSTAIGNDGITIVWSRHRDPYVDHQADSLFLVAQLRIWAHEIVWRTLGYDPRLQNSDRDPVANEEQYGQFQEVIGMPGYWQGAFYSAGPKAMLSFETGEWNAPGSDYSNGGAPRRWPPLYPGGAVTLTGEAGQEFTLDTADPLLLASSKSRPVPADPNDETLPYTIGAGVGEANAQTMLVLEGPYRRRGDEDQVDPIAGYAFEIEREQREGRTVQPVRVGYRLNDDGTVKIGNDGRPRFVVYQWYNPRLFGVDFNPLQGTWGAFRAPPPDAEGITARPLSVWDVGDGGDLISDVVQRVLLTTGTGGGWYSDEGLTTPLYGLGGQSSYFDRGVNDSGGPIPTDAEDASLGLGIPASMVAAPEEWAAVEDSTLGPYLKRCKVVSSGVLSARDLFARLLAPTGLAFGLAGGKYRLIDAWRLPAPNDAVMTITSETYAGKAGKRDSAIPRQSLRQHAAIDEINVNARFDPISKAYRVAADRGATDHGVCYRGQHIKHQVNADHAHVEGQTDEWLGGLATRWRKGFDFWGAEHSLVAVKLHEEDTIDVWPGDGVLFSDSQVLGDGSYGVSVAAALVIHREVNCEKHLVTFKMLLGREADFRMYAPAAMAWHYIENENGEGYRLRCHDDWLGDRGGKSFDVDGFVEPSWSTIGGKATIEIHQFDRVSWTGGIYGEVAGIHAEPGNCYIQLTGPLTGNRFFRDKHSLVILAPWAEQAADWVKRWYAPISGGVPGIPFMEA